MPVLLKTAFPVHLSVLLQLQSTLTITLMTGMEILSYFILSSDNVLQMHVQKMAAILEAALMLGFVDSSLDAIR